jgi:hypothetical protein
MSDRPAIWQECLVVLRTGFGQRRVSLPGIRQFGKKVLQVIVHLPMMPVGATRDAGELQSARRQRWGVPEKSSSEARRPEDESPHPTPTERLGSAAGLACSSRMPHRVDSAKRWKVEMVGGPLLTGPPISMSPLRGVQIDSTFYFGHVHCPAVSDAFEDNRSSVPKNRDRTSS